MKTCTDTPRASSRPSIPHTPVSERTPVSARPFRTSPFSLAPVSGRLPLSARYPYLFVYTDNDRPSPGCLNNPNNPNGLLPRTPASPPCPQPCRRRPDLRHFTQRTADARMPAASATYIRPTPARKQPPPATYNHPARPPETAVAGNVLTASSARLYRSATRAEHPVGRTTHDMSPETHPHFVNVIRIYTFFNSDIVQNLLVLYIQDFSTH